MNRNELCDIIAKHGKRFENGYYLYVKVFLSDLNITIDFKNGDKMFLSSNDFLQIGSTCFYQIDAIWDLEFY